MKDISISFEVELWAVATEIASARTLCECCQLQDSLTMNDLFAAFLKGCSRGERKRFTVLQICLSRVLQYTKKSQLRQSVVSRCWFPRIFAQWGEQMFFFPLSVVNWLWMFPNFIYNLVDAYGCQFSSKSWLFRGIKISRRTCLGHSRHFGRSTQERETVTGIQRCTGRHRADSSAIIDKFSFQNTSPVLNSLICLEETVAAWMRISRIWFVPFLFSWSFQEFTPMTLPLSK